MPSGEKGRKARQRNSARDVLESGSSENSREIRALFAYFGAKRADFLCRSDCVAEGKEFELPVRFPGKPLGAAVLSTSRDFVQETSEPEKQIMSGDRIS